MAITFNPFTGKFDFTGSNLKTKSGIIAAGSFAGNPKKSTVTFTTAFNNTNYSIVITGRDGRSWTYESKTISGFVISAGANLALTNEVSWIATANGETT